MEILRTDIDDNSFLSIICTKEEACIICEMLSNDKLVKLKEMISKQKDCPPEFNDIVSNEFDKLI